MTVDLSVATQIDLSLRLTVGLILGGVIGFERELHRQPAGFRTHSLVALGAALFTVVSAFGFEGSMADPTRIAAQIVSGIGFIGAGTILQHRGHIRGLTTAASLWAVAAIGTAAGAGMYVVAIAGTVLILVVLSLLDWVENFTKRKLQLGKARYDVPDEPEDGLSEDLP
ncbi:MAG: MgtC/SapB family protein [Chloroflexi bacterium]|nr:MgtC/SapB family protein [Chloroflexota bacterium]